jgi:hypothetical protein
MKEKLILYLQTEPLSPIQSFYVALYKNGNISEIYSSDYFEKPNCRLLTEATENNFCIFRYDTNFKKTKPELIFKRNIKDIDFEIIEYKLKEPDYKAFEIPKYI